MLLLLAEHWYEEGWWPLVAAIAALVGTNIFALLQMVAQSRESFAQQMRLNRIETLSEQLAGFYNPLYFLLSANGNAVERTGPATFPKDEFLAESAAANWKQIKECIIRPNNEEIARLLKENAHLMSASDNIEHYLTLNTHVAFYDIFSKSRTEAYENFRFPVAIVPHVAAVRTEMISELNDLRSYRSKGASIWRRTLGWLSNWKRSLELK